MSQADEGVHLSPRAAAVRVGGDATTDEWADLRPIALWFERRRPVLVTAIVLIAAQLAWRAQFLGHMYFFRADFLNLDLAIESPLRWHYLTYVGYGHLMIGERAIIWMLARISLYSWGLASAVSLIFQAAAGIAAFRLLRTLFGERPAMLIPLAVYLLSSLTVADFGWWTAALESLPLQLAVFMALDAHVRYVRNGRRRHIVTAAAWVAFGLLFFEKGLVLPLLLFAVTAGFAVGGSAGSGPVGVLLRYWRAWLLYAVLMLGYAVLLAVSLGTSPDQPRAPGSLAAVLTFTWGMVKDSLVPGALGGPWRWYPLPGAGYALAAAPPAFEWLALIVAVAVVAASVLRRRLAWRAWAILAGWVVLADMLPVVISRLNWYPILRALDTGYLADAVPVLAICLGLAVLTVTDGARSGPQASKAGPAALGRREYPVSGQKALRTPVIVLLAVFAVGSLWSAQAYESVTTGRPAASYIAQATQAIALAPRGTRVVDTEVPGNVSYQASDARASRVIGDIDPGKLRWIRQLAGTIDRLRIFGADGRLRPVWVYGASSGPPANSKSCWPERNGRIVIRFLGSPPYLTTVLRIGYIWGSSIPGTVEVRYGGRVRALAVLPGLHSAYLPVTGIADRVVMSGIGDAHMCVGDMEAGNPGPVRPAPAG